MITDSERPQLREYRLQLGWTQQEMAERLAHLAWMLYREHVAVNADMIAKWERGVKGISPDTASCSAGCSGPPPNNSD